MTLPSSSAQQVQATGHGQEAALSNARPSVTKKQRGVDNKDKSKTRFECNDAQRAFTSHITSQICADFRAPKILGPVERRSLHDELPILHRA